jgi:hypothetical protein
MNQDEVKQRLLRLHDCAEEFTVVFSGKKSEKVNGLYKYDSREILIHNRNFIDAGGNLNEQALFYTAMHELAHHILVTEKKQRGTRCHTRLFYTTLDDLADAAEQMGLYRPGIDGETQTLIEEARKISADIARLQRDLGRVLCNLRESCGKNGLRFEDVVKRKAQISGTTMKKCEKAAALALPGGIGADLQEAIIGERDGDGREAMIAAARAGKSVDQVKRVTAKAPKVDGEASLLKEKIRIENTIAQLKRRLEEITRRLKTHNGGEGNDEDG